MGNLVAIVGRPNVGKSTLFNRLTETRTAIVSETAGTTRDRQYGHVLWGGREFSLVDTGGWVVNSEDIFEDEINKQVEIAIEEADVILFLVDIMNGVTDLDDQVARILRKSGKEVIAPQSKVISSIEAGIPNYPEGKFFEGYGVFKKRHEVIDGVKVTRLPIVPRGTDNKILLMLNYFSYMVVACVWMLFHAIGHKYDRVFVQQLSPVMMSLPGVLYKKLRRVPLYTWVLDLWPESLTAAGGINNKWVLKFFARKTGTLPKRVIGELVNRETETKKRDRGSCLEK